MKKTEIKMDKKNRPQDINREIKTLRNWDWSDTPNATKERPVTIGQAVTVGDISGFISRYEGGYVFIEDSNQQGKLVAVEMKKFLKSFKVDTKKKDIVADLSIVGPSNASNGSIPKEDKGNIVKIDKKSTKVSDQKLSNKINKINSFSKFTNLANDFDSKTIKGKKKDISVELNKTADKKNDDFMKISKVKTYSQLQSDLESNPEKGKAVKSKNKNVEANIDKKANTHETTIKKVKTFSQLASEFESKPKQGGKIGSKKSIDADLSGKANKKDTKLDKIFQVKNISDFLTK
jgi:hypothetical protein